MKHLVGLLWVALALTLGWQGCVELPAATAGADSRAALVQPLADGHERTVLLPGDYENSQPLRDRLTDAFADRHQQSQAMVSDGQPAHRVCSSRPQRLLPVFPIKPSRISARLLSGYSRLLTPQKRFSDCRARTERAPFQSAASCDYYVFALRRLLC